MHTCASIALLISGFVAGAANAEPVRALLVTGGHGFEREPFFEMIDSIEGVEFTEFIQPAANEAISEGALDDYDVIVLYDMFHEITDEQKSLLLEAIDGGLGVVGLHHHIGAWETWTEWHGVIGGHYYQADTEVGGETRSASSYREGVDVSVTVADTGHPITQGVDDFTIHDEVYGNMWVAPDVDVLLTTDHPDGSDEVGWVTSYGEGRVAYLQLGHGPEAYANASYRRLLANAVVWAAEDGE